MVCGESLSALLRTIIANGILKGFLIKNYVPLVTHLFFTDDSLIFGKVTAKGALALKDCLDSYAQSSGQLANFDKLGLFFNFNVLQSRNNEIYQLLGVDPSMNKERYLGLPLMVRRNKKEAFREIKEKMLKNV